MRIAAASPLSVMAEPEASWNDARSGILLEGRDRGETSQEEAPDPCAAERYRIETGIRILLHVVRRRCRSPQEGHGGTPRLGTCRDMQWVRETCLGATSKLGEIRQAVFSPACIDIW